MQREKPCRSAPYGLSFTIEELEEARRWAERRRQVLTVALDRVIDGAEFEEMLLVLTRDRRRRVVTLWRTEAGVVSQPVGRLPAAYASVGAALRGASAPGLRRRLWFRA